MESLYLLMIYICVSLILTAVVSGINRDKLAKLEERIRQLESVISSNNEHIAGE